MIKYKTRRFHKVDNNEIMPVINHELNRLKNMCMLKYMKDRGILTDSFFYKLQNMVKSGKEISYNVINMIIHHIKEYYEKDLCYAIWLTDKEHFKGIPEENILSYETSEYVIADLGSEGILYGYESIPAQVGIFNDHKIALMDSEFIEDNVMKIDASYDDNVYEMLINTWDDPYLLYYACGNCPKTKEEREQFERIIIDMLRDVYPTRF